jgi:hypothetical protein
MGCTYVIIDCEYVCYSLFTDALLNCSVFGVGGKGKKKRVLNVQFFLLYRYIMNTITSVMEKMDITNHWYGLKWRMK